MHMLSCGSSDVDEVGLRFLSEMRASFPRTTETDFAHIRVFVDFAEVVNAPVKFGRFIHSTPP